MFSQISFEVRNCLKVFGFSYLIVLKEDLILLHFLGFFCVCVCVNGKTIPCQINNVVLVKEIINSSCVSRNSFQSLYIDSTVNKLSTLKKNKNKKQVVYYKEFNDFKLRVLPPI